MKVNKRGGFWDLNDITGAREPDEFYYIDSNELTFKQRNYAPGVGLGYTHAVSDTFTLTVNVSFIYFFGTFDIDRAIHTFIPSGTFETHRSNPQLLQLRLIRHRAQRRTGHRVLLNEKTVLTWVSASVLRMTNRNAEGLDDTRGSTTTCTRVPGALYRL
jgi:hypothetical protein